MAVPAGLALIWAILTLPAFLGIAGEVRIAPADAALLGLTTAIAGLLAGVRWVSAKAVNYNAPMVATGIGAMPTGMMANLFRGFEVLTFITAPLLLGWSPFLSLAIAAIAFYLIRGSLNTEDLQAQQEANKKALEAARVDRNEARKQKIPTPRRPGQR